MSVDPPNTLILVFLCVNRLIFNQSRNLSIREKHCMVLEECSTLDLMDGQVIGIPQWCSKSIRVRLFYVYQSHITEFLTRSQNEALKLVSFTLWSMSRSSEFFVWPSKELPMLPYKMAYRSIGILKFLLKWLYAQWSDIPFYNLLLLTAFVILKSIKKTHCSVLNRWRFLHRKHVD